jgi:hypothetical protein
LVVGAKSEQSLGPGMSNQHGNERPQYNILCGIALKAPFTTTQAELSEKYHQDIWIDHYTIYMDEYSSLRTCKQCGNKEMYEVSFPLKGDLCLKHYHKAKHKRIKAYNR